MRRPTWAPSPSLWILAVLCSVAILLLALPGLAAPQEKAPPPSRPEAKSSQVVSGCAVQVTGGKRGTDVASAWETCSGGSLNIEVADSSTGSDQHHTTTPGHKYIDTLTLRGPLAGAQWGASDSYEVLENGAGKFAIEIDGAPLSSANVESITMEDLVIDEREMTTGVDWDYRVYGPGDAHYGSISIRSRASESTELFDWWAKAAQGQISRKNISVVALKRDGGEARRYNYLECFPVKYMPHSLDQPGAEATEGILVRCGGVTLHGEDQQALFDWINETLAGGEYRRSVRLTEELFGRAVGRSFTYHDAFPVRYVFPQFSASGTGNLYEEIAIKPIRLELR